MVAKRRGRGRARRARSDGPKKLGRNGGTEGSDIDDDEEESGKSSDTAIPAKRAGEPSSPSAEDAGAQGSGEASPVRSSPTPLGGVAKKTKRTSSKRFKNPPSGSQEEDEAEDSGDARGAPLPDGSADSGRDNKSAATTKRGKKRSPSPLQEEERPEKRIAGPDAETVAASDPKRKRKKKKSKRSAEEDRRKEEEKRSAEKARRKKEKRSAKKDRRKKEEKKQPRRALTPLLELEHNDNSEDTPSSPEIFQDDEHHDSEMSEEEPSNTSLPPEDGRAREGEQQEKDVAERVDAGGTSPPHEKDMHSAHGEEDAVNQKDGDGMPPSSPKDKHSVDEEELPKDTSTPQEKNKDQEDEETAGAQAVNGKNLQVNNAPSTKLCGSETEKKPAVDRSLWSYDDEFKILNALVEHAQSHDGALPDSSHLLANLTFDKIDANEEKLTDKIRKLKTRYHKMLSRGCPSDRLASRLFKLSEKLWGQVDEDEQVEPTSRDFSALSKVYPHLAKEVKAYAEAHSSRDLIMAMVMTIGDEKARDLDAKCKKLQIEAFKLELDQASLINELLSALPSLTRVSF